jgi:hypothetical protein
METTMQTIELVTFRLNPGINRADFLAAAQRTEAAVRRQPGFQARMLAEGADGTWADIVTWASHDAAMTAAKVIMSDPDFAPFGQMIDGASLSMSHATLALKTD